MEVLGIGTAALLGGDLTDPEDDGNEAAGDTDPSWNWKAIFANSEPGFNGVALPGTPAGTERSYNVFDNAADGGEMGGEAICSFSIPLITIIAMFVLSLFLPIVVFIFNLWFLLVFRFCIPPQIKVAAGLDAALAVTPPKIDLDAEFSVKIEGLDTLVDPDDLHDAEHHFYQA